MTPTSDVVLRPAVVADHPSYTRLFAELGVHDPIPTRERFAERILAQLTIAERAGEVVGFGSWRRYGALAHVVQLVVDPTARGQRIGETVLRHIRALAVAAGCTRWYLNVKRDNASAIRLYERVGFARELEAVALRLDWERLAPRAVTAGLLDPAEDPAAAARFAIPLERLATLRTRGLLHVIGLREAGELVGLAAFDPEHPGAMIFRAARPALAGELLAAIRPFALAGARYLHITVEGGPALAAAVIALGAEVSFELLRMAAPLAEVHS